MPRDRSSTAEGGAPDVARLALVVPQRRALPVGEDKGEGVNAARGTGGHRHVNRQ
jgi:hypothetical protein